MPSLTLASCSEPPRHREETADGHEARAFVSDGTPGINIALSTWHWGPYPLMYPVDLVNVQGAGSWSPCSCDTGEPAGSRIKR